MTPSGADAPTADAPGPPAPTWEQPDEPGHSHDPNEVTVQLDGAGRRLDDPLVQRSNGAPGSPEAGDGSDGPVFVDESGRRSRRFRRLGILVGLACAVYAVVIVVTLLSGNSNAPWLPVPGQGEDQPAGQVDTSPLPTDADPAKPSGSGAGGVAPGASPTVSGGTRPSPGASTSPGASASPTDPAASTGPKPSTSTTAKPDPGTSTTKAPAPEPSNPVVDPPGPTPSDSVSPSPDPSDSPVTGGSGAGTGTVAEGPVQQGPVDRSPTEPSVTSSSYPENIL